MADDDDLIVRAQLHDELSPGLRNLRRTLNETTREAERLGTSAGKKTAPGLDQVTRSSKTLRSSVSQTHQTLLSMSTDLGNRVATDVKRGAAALGAFATATAVFGLKSASNFQTSRIAFQTLLGSVEKGNALFDRLQQLNLKTPFELSDIAPATQLLLRYGVAGDQVVGVLQSLMDAAALSGDPANNLQRLALATGQVISQGRILGQDARQLAESGINVYDLVAQKLHITQAEARKLGEEGKLSSDLYIQGLLRMEGPLAKLQGGAEKLNKTLAGQLSNLKDAIRVRLADTAGPLTEQLTHDMPMIVRLAGDFADKIGTPIFRLLGQGAGFVEKLLPLAEGPLAALFGGLGQILDAAGPALPLLAPLADQMTNAITALVTQLLPDMPDIVRFFIALVGVLPEAVHQFGLLIKLSMPLVRLATGLLEFGPARDVLATLLITLLGYSKLSGLVGGIKAFATALRIVGNEAETAGAKASIAQGKLGGIAAIVGGVALAGPQLADVTSGKSSIGQDLQFIGGATAIGAGIGSVVPGVGTALGAGAGAVVGTTYDILGHILGDPVVPGGIAARHNAANTGPGSSMRHITSGIRNHTVRSSNSGHVRGTAVDVVGPQLTSYVQRVRDRGGWATLENGPGGMHAHADFGDPATHPRTGSTLLDDLAGLRVTVNVNGPVTGQVDFERGAQRGLEKAIVQIERARYRRAYSPVRKG